MGYAVEDDTLTVVDKTAQLWVIAGKHQHVLDN